MLRPASCVPNDLLGERRRGDIAVDEIDQTGPVVCKILGKCAGTALEMPGDAVDPVVCAPGNMHASAAADCLRRGGGGDLSRSGDAS